MINRLPHLLGAVSWIMFGMVLNFAGCQNGGNTDDVHHDTQPYVDQTSPGDIADTGDLLAFDLSAADPSETIRVPTLSEAVAVVPSAGLPKDAPIQPANNNLDVIRYQGRVYLAFRTAPNHFASAETTLLIMSSTDEISWESEAMFFENTDLREPRFLIVGDTLWLYFAVLGSNIADFEPKGMMASQRLINGRWSDPRWVYLPTFIPWRGRAAAGVSSLVGYVGGEKIYDNADPRIEIHWLQTDNGLEFSPMFGTSPIIQIGGGSEADIAALDGGGWVMVVRNELGDDYGWGSKICRGDNTKPPVWTCAADPKKYDSPLLFRHKSDVYLFGRRTLTETGEYDLGTGDNLDNQLAYWTTPKRCSLWKVDADSLSVEWVLDLASKGDTCFVSVLDNGGGEFTVYNYSSPIEEPELSWLDGQLGPTQIYRQTLSLP